MAGIADNLYGDKRIESFSTYVGDSAPRFILLFDPSAPEDGHGQMIIVTTGNDVRDDVRSELDQFIADKYPDARAHTRLITTGPPSDYPVMFRLIGEDNKKTAELAVKALDIMRKNPDIVNASLDWPEEMPSIKLKINQTASASLASTTMPYRSTCTRSSPATRSLNRTRRPARPDFLQARRKECSPAARPFLHAGSCRKRTLRASWTVCGYFL